MNAPPRLADLNPEEAAAASRLQAPRRQRSLGELAMLALLGVPLASVCIYVRERYGLELSLALLPELAVGYLAAVLAHEAGHAITASMVGFRISAIAVWPLRLQRDGSSWRATWLPRDGPKGFVSVVPSGTQRLRMRQFLIVAAGPLASMLFAVICWLALNRAAATAPRWLGDQILVAGLWSLVITAGGLLPVRAGSSVPDGARMRMLIHGGAEWDRLSAQHALTAASMAGTRPRDWPPELVEAAAGPDDGSPEACSGRALRYNWLLDQGRLVEGEQQLVWLLCQAWTTVGRREWSLQAAWFAGLFLDDPQTARKWFESATQRSEPAHDCSFQMAEAAVAAAERRSNDVPTLVSAALASCQEMSDRGTAAAISDALRTLSAKGE